MIHQDAGLQAELIARPYLSIDEITQLIAVSFCDLPSVRTVEIADVGEIAVSLNNGRCIEVQTIPVARALSQPQDRRAALDELAKRCA